MHETINNYWCIKDGRRSYRSMRRVLQIFLPTPVPIQLLFYVKTKNEEKMSPLPSATPPHAKHNGIITMTNENPILDSFRFLMFYAKSSAKGWEHIFLDRRDHNVILVRHKFRQKHIKYLRFVLPNISKMVIFHWTHKTFPSFHSSATLRSLRLQSVTTFIGLVLLATIQIFRIDSTFLRDTNTRKS